MKPSIILSWVTFLLVLILSGCSKDKDDPVVATINTTPVTEITQYSARSGGTISNDGGASITAKGVVWSTKENPSLEDHSGINIKGEGAEGFTVVIDNLLPDTKYYVKAYATNSAGTAYGNQQSFTTFTVTIPMVSTNNVSEISFTSALTGGNVTEDGGFPITMRGVCWSTSPTPNLTNSHSNDGTGLGGFISSLTSLSPATKYYVRAYATNTNGTGYGNILSFTTLQMATPVVTTNEVTSITPTTAICGGKVLADGGSGVTARGVVWGKTQNPSIQFNSGITYDGVGIQPFTSNISGLEPGKKYYVRAYATNNAGTAYGAEVSFSTPEPIYTSINEFFDSVIDDMDISLPDWKNITESGTRKWRGKTFIETKYAQMTSYNSNNQTDICWLITPQVDFSGKNVVMSLRTSKAYWTHEPVTVWLIENLTGDDIANARKTAISCTLASQSDPDHTWISSGIVDLSGFSGVARVGFKYYGSNPNGLTSTFRVDDVQVNPGK